MEEVHRVLRSVKSLRKTRVQAEASSTRLLDGDQFKDNKNDSEEEDIYQTPTPIVAPMMKFDNYQVPNTLKECYDEILTYIFSFLSSKDLLQLARVCRRFNQISGSDIIWQREYLDKKWERITKPKIEAGFKRQYLDCSHEYKTVVTRRRRATTSIANIGMMRRFLACGYCLLPCTIFIGLLIMCILGPIMMDGTIARTAANYGYTLIPLGLLVIIPFVLLAICFCMDPVILGSMQKKHYQTLGRQFHIEGDTIRGLYSVLIGIAFIPLFILSIWLKGMFYPDVSYRVAFIPVYVASFLAVMLPIVQSIAYCMLYRTVDGMELTVTSGMKVAFLNIVAPIQTVLIAAKLDGAITGPWGAVCIPIWLSIVYFCCLCPAYCCCYLATDKEVLMGLATVSCILFCCLIPIFAFVLFIVLRADIAAWSFSFAITFIPCYIFFCIFGCFLCCFLVSATSEKEIMYN